MKKASICFLFSILNVYAVEFQTVHSSMHSYIENIKFENSKQKNDGVVFGIGADIHIGASEYKFTYENGNTDTKKPPLNKDLKIDKIFLQYSYKFNDKISTNINYININDNIAITDNGKAYGVGLSFRANKKLSTNLTQFYVDYKYFDTYQSDLSTDYKIKIENIKLKLSSNIKYIEIEEKQRNAFTKNAKNNYLTYGLKVHSHYNSWHFGMASYFGKRVFAIMNSGFKIQHHAMEFEKTFAVGIGKTFGKTIVRLQHIYQKATELPIQNSDVKVNNTRLIISYKW